MSEDTGRLEYLHSLKMAAYKWFKENGVKDEEEYCVDEDYRAFALRVLTSYYPYGASLHAIITAFWVACSRDEDSCDIADFHPQALITIPVFLAYQAGDHDGHQAGLLDGDAGNEEKRYAAKYLKNLRSGYTAWTFAENEEIPTQGAATT